MSFLIPSAFAAAAPEPGAPGLMSNLLFFVFLILIFYFMLIRPQQKRQKEHRAMVDALAKGDEVMTSGGMLGKVVDISDQYLTVEIADGVNVKVRRDTVGALMPKGTIKSV